MDIEPSTLLEWMRVPGTLMIDPFYFFEDTITNDRGTTWAKDGFLLPRIGYRDGCDRLMGWFRSNGRSGALLHFGYDRSLHNSWCDNDFLACQGSTDVGKDGLPGWLWDPGILLREKFLCRVRMIDTVMTVIDRPYFWGVHRGTVETSARWQDLPSFRSSRFNDGRHFAVLRLIWDPGVTVTGSSRVARGERTDGYLPAQGVEILAEKFIEKWASFTQWLITLRTAGGQEVSWVGTLQGSTLSKGHYQPPRLHWDPGIILGLSSFSWVTSRAVLVLLEDKQFLGREDCHVPFSRRASEGAHSLTLPNSRGLRWQKLGDLPF